MKTWAIVLTAVGDHWVLHIPEIDRQRQTERLETIRDRARSAISEIVGADHDHITVRFHNVSGPVDLSDMDED